MRGLLEGHMDAEKHLENLAKAHEKDRRRSDAQEMDSDSDMEVPAELEDFFGQAVEEMPDQDLPEKQRRQLRKVRQSGGFDAARRRLSGKSLVNAPPSDQPAPEVPEADPNREHYQRRSDLAWVRPLVPEAPTDAWLISHPKNISFMICHKKGIAWVPLDLNGKHRLLVVV